MSLLSVAQMNSQNDIEENFKVIESFIQQSKAQGSSLVVFPENFVCFAAGKQRDTAQQFEAIQKRLETSGLLLGPYPVLSAQMVP